MRFFGKVREMLETLKLVVDGGKDGKMTFGEALGVAAYRKKRFVEEFVRVVDEMGAVVRDSVRLFIMRREHYIGGEFKPNYDIKDAVGFAENLHFSVVHTIMKALDVEGLHDFVKEEILEELNKKAVAL